MANQSKLKAWVRYDGTGRVVTGGPIFQANKPKVGNWKQMNANLCCNGSTPSTTTTTTTNGGGGATYYYTGDYYYNCNFDQSNVTIQSTVPLTIGSWYTDVESSCINFIITGTASSDPLAYQVDPNSASSSCTGCPTSVPFSALLGQQFSVDYADVCNGTPTELYTDGSNPDQIGTYIYVDAGLTTTLRSQGYYLFGVNNHVNVLNSGGDVLGVNQFTCQ